MYLTPNQYMTFEAILRCSLLYFRYNMSLHALYAIFKHRMTLQWYPEKIIFTPSNGHGGGVILTRDDFAIFFKANQDTLNKDKNCFQ